MAGKKVSFSRKPIAVEKPVAVEDWVAHREVTVEVGKPSPAPPKVEPEKTKRLTLDIPESLHKAIKLTATNEGVTMVELLRQLLEEHYGTKD